VHVSEATKDIDLDGAKYRVGRMTAMVASRIFNLLMTSSIKASTEAKVIDTSEKSSEMEPTEENANGMVAFLWISCTNSLDEDQYAKIQNQCLLVCSRYENDSPLPVKMVDGRWAMKDLEKDALTVNRLVTEALQFNISPFFLAGLSKAAATPA
jgi:hypothetical protein